MQTHTQTHIDQEQWGQVGCLVRVGMVVERPKK